MSKKISVLINTQNEEKNIARVIKSVDFADEIIVCDMHSDDKTVEIAKKMGANVFLHKREEYVEPARNFSISKATNDWILVLDPDEQIPQSLVKRLQEIASNMKQIDYVKIPRKNIIFGRWMKASMWWPDLNVRFFKKGNVSWTDKIHRPPEVSGQGLDLPAEDKWAIIHYHYDSITQFLERMMRYTKVQARELVEGGYKFDWKDLLRKPLDEFLSRFFANKGYEDGIHGLALSLLQAFSFLVVYLKVWEFSSFKEGTIEIAEVDEERKKAGNVMSYWIKQAGKSKSVFKRIFNRLI